MSVAKLNAEAERAMKRRADGAAQKEKRLAVAKPGADEEKEKEKDVKKKGRELDDEALQKRKENAMRGKVKQEERALAATAQIALEAKGVKEGDLDAAKNDIDRMMEALLDEHKDDIDEVEKGARGARYDEDGLWKKYSYAMKHSRGSLAYVLATVYKNGAEPRGKQASPIYVRHATSLGLKKGMSAGGLYHLSLSIEVAMILHYKKYVNFPYRDLTWCPESHVGVVYYRCLMKEAYKNVADGEAMLKDLEKATWVKTSKPSQLLKSALSKRVDRFPVEPEAKDDDDGAKKGAYNIKLERLGRASMLAEIVIALEYEDLMKAKKDWPSVGDVMAQCGFGAGAVI